MKTKIFIGQPLKKENAIMKRLSYSLAVIVFVFVSNSTFAQCRELIDSTVTMGLDIDARHLVKYLKTKEQIDATYRDVRMSAEWTNDVLKEIYSSLERRAYESYPKEAVLICGFLKELTNYQLLIDQLLFTNNKDSIRRQLDAIEEDIRYKFIPSGRGNPSDPPSSRPTFRPVLTTVKVRVLDNAGAELSGYDVYAKPALSNNRFLTERFNPTKNAVKAISPGRKNIWIEKNGILIKSTDIGIRRNEREIEMADFIID
jgi:hypothetical protein